jgi:hypothetical protein
LQARPVLLGGYLAGEAAFQVIFCASLQSGDFEDVAQPSLEVLSNAGVCA